MSKVLGQFVQVDRRGTHARLVSKLRPHEFDALTETECEVLDATQGWQIVRVRLR
jgi:hypothetical protein